MIADSMKSFVKNSSAIRAMFEEGKKMASNIFPPNASPEPPKADYSSMSESEIHEAFEKMKFGS